jgi:hypothetical protein
LQFLRTFGAEVVEKPRLHSKLYMREPGPSGGLSARDARSGRPVDRYAEYLRHAACANH